MISLRNTSTLYWTYLATSTGLLFNSIQKGPLCGRPRMAGGKKAPLPKICHRHPTMMKLGTPYRKRPQKYVDHVEPPLSSSGINIFSTFIERNQEMQLYQEIQV